MKCPYCHVGVRFVVEHEKVYSTRSSQKKDNRGVQIISALCPECGEPVAIAKEGLCRYIDDGPEIVKADLEYIIFPRKVSAMTAEAIPLEYRMKYNEAYSVLAISPKSSAALCRRLLQEIFWQELKIKKRNLNDEIQEALKLPPIRGDNDLSKGIDAIRMIGNFASHPMKSENTGCIVDVEQGEAEFCLDILERLLELVFVQPSKSSEFHDRLNKKLTLFAKNK